MKITFYIKSLLLFFAVTSYSIVHATDKIAVVNISGVFQESAQRALVAKNIEKEFNNRAIELQAMEHDLHIKMQNLQRDSSIMKESERNTLEKAVIEQREIFSQKAQEFEQEKHHRQIEERNKILIKIQDTVRDIAIKKGYDVIIDSNAVAYASNIKDITIDVLKAVK